MSAVLYQIDVPSQNDIPYTIDHPSSVSRTLEAYCFMTDCSVADASLLAREACALPTGSIAP